MEDFSEKSKVIFRIKSENGLLGQAILVSRVGGR
jgi:hypothetical protein